MPSLISYMSSSIVKKKAKKSGIEAIQNFLTKNHIFYQHDSFHQPKQAPCCLYLWQLISYTDKSSDKRL